MKFAIVALLGAVSAQDALTEGCTADGAPNVAVDGCTCHADCALCAPASEGTEAESCRSCPAGSTFTNSNGDLGNCTVDSPPANNDGGDGGDGDDGDAGDAAKEGDKCTMGNDDCGYEADQKLICAEADMSGASMTDDQKKKLTDAGASDDDITKAEEAMQAMGTVAVCTASANCESDSEKMKEADDMGVSVTCSAKALAGAMVTVLGALATM